MPWLNLPTVPFTEEEETLADRRHLTQGDAALERPEPAGSSCGSSLTLYPALCWAREQPAPQKETRALPSQPVSVVKMLPLKPMSAYYQRDITDTAWGRNGQLSTMMS